MNLNGRGRIVLALVGLLLVGALVAVPGVYAFEGRGGDVVTIGPDEVIEDDLYVGAGTFTLEGTVQGDLVVFGGTLTINGTVEGDLIAAGQTVVVNGTVEDDARVAGYAITLPGTIADDVIAAGFSLESEEGASIGGDVVYAGYQALLGGDVGGDLRASGGAVRIVGAVEGDAQVDVGGTEEGEAIPPFYNFMPNVPTVPSIPAGLTLAEGATIGGDLTYTANFRADVPGGAVAGETDFNEYVPDVPEREERRPPSPAAQAARWLFRQLRRLASFVLIGFLTMWLVPGWTRTLAKNVEEKPLPSLGWGVVTIGVFLAGMALLVVLSVLLTVVLGAITLGGLAGRLAVLGGIVTTTAGFSFSIMWRYITTIVVGLLLGQLIFRALNSPAEENRWLPMLLGVVILIVITAVPILGWLAKLAIVLFGLGALWIWGLEALSGPKAAEPAVQA
jgi:cytoskeletal protein CcmA (bactofilin family)